MRARMLTVAGLAVVLVGCGSAQAAAPVTSTATVVHTVMSTVTKPPVTVTVTTTATPTSATVGQFDLTGTFALTDLSLDGSCIGTGGYSDIQPGASVTVYNSAGVVEATGALGSGKYDNAGTCTYELLVQGVPDDSAFYQVEITHRGKITVPASEAKDGQFAGTLGGS